MNQQNIDMEMRKEKLRKGVAGFAIAIAILTFIGAILLPIISDYMSFDDAEVIISLVISIGLGMAFLVVGIMFMRRDSEGLAITLLVFFILYVVERIFMIAMGGGVIVIFWLVLGVMCITQILQYLRVHRQQLLTNAITQQPMAPQQDSGQQQSYGTWPPPPQQSPDQVPPPPPPLPQDGVENRSPDQGW